MAKSELIGIRVSPDERVQLSGAAITEAKSLSEFIRDAALERAGEPSASRRSDGPPLDAFVSDDQQINTVLAKLPRRSGDA